MHLLRNHHVHVILFRGTWHHVWVILHLFLKLLECFRIKVIIVHVCFLFLPKTCVLAHHLLLTHHLLIMLCLHILHELVPLLLCHAIHLLLYSHGLFRVHALKNTAERHLREIVPWKIVVILFHFLLHLVKHLTFVVLDFLLRELSLFVFFLHLFFESLTLWSKLI
jgi:hypothetical protein